MFCFLSHEIKYHLGKQETEHHVHKLLDALAAAFYRHLCAQPASRYGAQSGGDRDGVADVSAECIYDHAGQVGCQIGHLGASRGAHKLQSKERSKRHYEERSRARADHSVIDTHAEADEDGDQGSKRQGYDVNIGMSQ